VFRKSCVYDVKVVYDSVWCVHSVQEAISAFQNEFLDSVNAKGIAIDRRVPALALALAPAHASYPPPSTAPRDTRPASHTHAAHRPPFFSASEIGPLLLSDPVRGGRVSGAIRVRS